MLFASDWSLTHHMAPHAEHGAPAVAKVKCPAFGLSEVMSGITRAVTPDMRDITGNLAMHCQCQHGRRSGR